MEVNRPEGAMLKRCFWAFRTVVSSLPVGSLIGTPGAGMTGDCIVAIAVLGEGAALPDIPKSKHCFINLPYSFVLKKEIQAGEMAQQLRALTALFRRS